MQNPSTEGEHSAYYSAIHQADADLDKAISHVRAEEDAGRLTPVQTAAERCGLLECHLRLCRQARLEHLGGTP